jgi:hypothetical protein
MTSSHAEDVLVPQEQATTGATGRKNKARCRNGIWNEIRMRLRHGPAAKLLLDHAAGPSIITGCPGWFEQALLGLLLARDGTVNGCHEEAASTAETSLFRGGGKGGGRGLMPAQGGNLRCYWTWIYCTASTVLGPAPETANRVIECGSSKQVTRRSKWQAGVGVRTIWREGLDGGVKRRAGTV